MPRCARQEREVVHAGAMRHRRGIDDGVIAVHVVDVHEVAGRHRLQIALRLHHPLGPAGGARGVEQPGQVVRCARLQGPRCGGQRGRMAGLSGYQQLAQRRQFVARRPQGIGQLVRHEQHRGCGVTHDEGHLARVQLGIDRHHGQSGPQRAIERLQVGRLVVHEEGHARAGLQAEIVAQVSGQPGRTLGQLRIAQLRPLTEPQRATLRLHACGPLQPTHQVHRSTCPAGRSGSACGCARLPWRSPSVAGSISSISAATPR